MKLPDKNDKEMLAELDKAYEYAASVRVDKIRYKRDLICHPDTIIKDYVVVFFWDKNIYECLIDALTGFISDELLV